MIVSSEPQLSLKNIMGNIDFIADIIRDCCRAFELWIGILEHGPQPETPKERKLRLKLEAKEAINKQSQMSNKAKVCSNLPSNDEIIAEFNREMDKLLYKKPYSFPVTAWVGKHMK